MKYIIFKRNISGAIQEVPVIFPNELVHADVAAALKANVLPNAEIVAAGDINSLNFNCHGKSTTLNAASRHEVDERVILCNDYLHGFVDE